MASVFHTPLKPSELFLALTLAHVSRKSLMIWGAPGIGKSDIARQFANYRFPIVKKERSAESIENEKEFLASIGKKASLVQETETPFPVLNQETNIIDIRLSQIEPTDLRGIPVPVKFYVDRNGAFVPDHIVAQSNNPSEYKMTNQVFWAPPAILSLPKDWEGVIFLDEVTSAMPVTQAASYQLFLDRCIGELKLPEKAFILAAGNREGDGGVTFKLALPLRDRMVHVELKEDLPEWKDNYAIKRQVYPSIVAYLSTNATDFNTLGASNPNICGGSSPRSWVVASDLMYAHDEVFKNSPAATKKSARRVLWATIEGTVGDDVAGRFKTFHEMTSKLPATIDILEGRVKDLNGYEVDVSKGFAVCLNLAYKIISTNAEVKEGQEPEGTLHGYYDNMLRFLDKAFDSEPELIMMTMKTIFMQKIFVNAVKIPFYRDFCKKYSALLSKSREQAYA